MRRTRVLIGILLLLISIFIFYYVIHNYEEVSNQVVKIVKVLKKYSRKAVVIPESNEYHRTYVFETVSETDNFETKNK